MRPWVLPVGALALAVLGAAWFLSSFERVAQKEWVRPTGEARRNPYLAAQRFAARMGIPAQPLPALPQLDELPRDAALLLPAGRQAIDPRRLRRIAAWTESGGYLIVEAELPGVSDPLLDALGIERRRGPRGFKPAPLQTAQGRKLNVALHGGTALRLPDDAHVLFSAGNREAPLIAALEYGRGTVTVAGSFAFARNSTIGTADNAEFFWYLLGLAHARELGVFVRQERLSLWSFLTQHAAPTLIAGAVLLALWLWRIGPRFGPVLPDPPPARRRLLEHLRATGRYYWTKGLRAHLVAAARESALHHLGRMHPDFTGAPPAERVRRLSTLASLPEEAIARFMSVGAPASGQEFVHLMHTAQAIHSALEKGQSTRGVR